MLKNMAGGGRGMVHIEQHHQNVKRIEEIKKLS